jgi:hypothetical protein
MKICSFATFVTKWNWDIDERLYLLTGQFNLLAPELFFLILAHLYIKYE